MVLWDGSIKGVELCSDENEVVVNSERDGHKVGCFALINAFIVQLRDVQLNCYIEQHIIVDNFTITPPFPVLSVTFPSFSLVTLNCPLTSFLS